MRRLPGQRRGASFLALASIAILACSAIVNHADSQCATDADCAKFPGTVCAQGGCVAAQAPVDAGGGGVDHFVPPITTCTTTQDCLAIHNATNWICRRTDHTCVSLASNDCASVIGQYSSDDVILLGALLPLFGAHQSTGAAMADAIRLAVQDFSAGLPPSTDGGASRPIAVVMCDESDDVDRAARHLRDDLQIAAILGAGESESTLRVAADVTNQGGQLLMSPRATADLTSVASKGLVWRTCPTDALEASALAAVTSTVVVPALQGAGVASPRVAIVHASDPESTEITAKVASALGAGDAGVAPTQIDYGDPDAPGAGDPSAKYTDAINEATQSATLPDLIVFVGTTQGVTSVLAGIETNWPPSAPRRAQYVVSSGAQTKELLALIGTNDALRKRILGTSPGADPAAYANLSKFLVRYRQTFTDGTLPETFGVAQAYDAFYTLAFAASVTRNVDLVGADVLSALRLILGTTNPVSIDVGPEAIPTAYGALAGGKPLRLNGASSPLAFDAQKGDLVTDVQVWCILRGQTNAPAYQTSGLSYSASAGALQGAIGAGCGQ